MCISPITIKNLNYGLKHLGQIRDVTSTHIQVPCGHCYQCVTQRQTSYEQRIEMDLFDRDIYFMTLTYQDSALHRTGHSVYDLAYADYKDLQNLFKRYRKHFAGRSCSDIRYMAVNEYGSSKHRPHFHVLFSVPKLKDRFDLLHQDDELYDWFKNNWKRNLGTTFKPVWQPLYLYVRKYIGSKINCTFDLHRVVEKPDKPFASVGFYITKYVLKYDKRTSKLIDKITLDKTLSRDDRLDLLRKLRPRVRSSKRFGLLDTIEKVNYVLRQIDKALETTPGLAFYTFSPVTGKQQLLCAPYRKKLITLDHIKRQAAHLEGLLVPGSRALIAPLGHIVDAQTEQNSVIQKQVRFQRQLEYLEKKHIFAPDNLCQTLNDLQTTRNTQL